MPASYPTSVKTFTTKSDGAGNTILAAHINDLQLEVTAIETDLVGDVFARTAVGSVNVQDFGAVGDNVADDTVALQSAIDTAGAEGTVWFPPGDYRTTATINLFYEGQTWLMHGATIYTDFNGVGLLVGDETQAGALGAVKRWKLNGGMIRHFDNLDWTSGTCGIKMQKANNCTLRDFSVVGFERGVWVTTPGAAEDRWETTQNWFFPQQIMECKHAWDFFADDDCCVNENQVTGGDHFTSASAPSMAGVSMIRIDRHAAALGTVNGIKFWGSYFSNGHAGADRPTLLALDGVGCTFMDLHAENFQTNNILLSGDALLGGVPNRFSFAADSFKAEDNLASGTTAVAAAFDFQGTDGCQLSGGLAANSTYVQAFRQLGAVTKPTVVVKDLNDNNTFIVDGKGGIRSRAANVPNHHYITPLAAGTGTDDYAKIQSSNIAGLTDDATVTILTGVNNESGILHVTIWNASSGAIAGASIVFSVSAAAPSGVIMAQGGTYTFAVTTADVTGTTGVDGQFTISFRAGIIEMENRIGATVRLKYWMVHG